MLLIESPHSLDRVFLENGQGRDAHSRRGPHVGNINILKPVVVVVETADTHPRPDVFDSGLQSHIREGSVAIVVIEILPPEIVYHEKIGPAIAVIVGPSAGETESRVVLSQAGLPRHIAEGTVAVVAHHEVRWTVFGVVVR